MTVAKYISKKPLAIAIATTLFSTSLFAGQIVTDATVGDTSTANTQFGFGGWNLDNVDVKIVDVDDVTLETGAFDPVVGTYTTMVLGDTFESEIKSTDALGDLDEIRGLLHGKNWPVGEPSGIKIINGDTKTSHGKPENCIMTTSYFDATDDGVVNGYLDTVGTPAICSSSFQSHKRFKINLQPTTVANVATATSGDGLPVDITFNLKEGDASSQDYQVLQKLNNYTGKRLDGYKIEVLDATGNPNASLTLSLGAGEDDTDPLIPADIWDTEDVANFSHGLWGPQEIPNFPTNGFFDSERAFYPATLAADEQSISYAGDMQGGNYQTLFGNWLPSEWAPEGIFYDDDNNPETDGKLVAFWGDPNEVGTNAWHEGNDDGFALIDEDYLLGLLSGSEADQYSRDVIEDVLNLGLNYIVKIGDNREIGDTFTIRITPHVALDQDEPAYVASPAPVIEIPEESSGSSSSSFDAYNSQSFFMMFFGFIGIGLLMARRRLGKVTIK